MKSNVVELPKARTARTSKVAPDKAKPKRLAAARSSAAVAAQPDIRPPVGQRKAGSFHWLVPTTGLKDAYPKQWDGVAWLNMKRNEKRDMLNGVLRYGGAIERPVTNPHGDKRKRRLAPT